MEEKKKVTLPENAFRELKPGEQYQPLLRPDKVYPEVTVWSVTVGLHHILSRSGISGAEGRTGL